MLTLQTTPEEEAVLAAEVTRRGVAGEVVEDLAIRALRLYIVTIHEQQAVAREHAVIEKFRQADEAGKTAVESSLSR